MIKVDTTKSGAKVEMKGSWMEITAEVRAALVAYYETAKEGKNETYARAKIRAICGDVLAPEKETKEDMIKRWTKCITEEMIRRERQ